MNVAVNIWDKLSRVAIFLVFIALLLLVAVRYLPLIQQNERYRKEILRLDSEIQKKEETGRQLKLQVEALRHDPKAIERLAREQLGYGKPGETVIRFEAAPTNAVLRP